MEAKAWYHSHSTYVFSPSCLSPLLCGITSVCHVRGRKKKTNPSSSSLGLECGKMGAFPSLGGNTDSKKQDSEVCAHPMTDWIWADNDGYRELSNRAWSSPFLEMTCAGSHHNIQITLVAHEFSVSKTCKNDHYIPNHMFLMFIRSQDCMFYAIF